MEIHFNFNIICFSKKSSMQFKHLGVEVEARHRGHSFKKCSFLSLVSITYVCYSLP